MLELGFYCGLAILYPYSAVYCPTDSCLGDCRSATMLHSQSAPLPVSYKFCLGADDMRMGVDRWYQWTPRIVAPDRQGHLSTTRICYWEDRGTPRNIRDLGPDE